MRRWFLSYNSQDLALMQGLEAALRRKDAEAHIFFALKSLRAGGFWLPELVKEIAEATAFVLLVGENGVSPWQIAEYYEAIDRRVKEQNFPVMLVLLDSQPAPGPSHPPSSCTSIKARSFMCVPNRASGAASPKSLRGVFAIRACARS
jgi:hypothetical protein